MKVKYECVVIGVSAGGLNALQRILPHIPYMANYSVIIVQHLHVDTEKFHIDFFNSICQVKVTEANEKEKIKPGMIYFAPPDYHLLVEESKRFALSVDKKVNYSRPSIDLLFESAAEVFTNKLVGIILTGANSDGAGGLKKIQLFGGLTIVQNPEEAEMKSMPQSALLLQQPNYIFSLSEVANFLTLLGKK